MMINSNTESLCPHCLMKIPAKIVSIGNEIYLDKDCPEPVSYTHLSQNKTTCCGFGGLMTFANKEVSIRAIDRRINESQHPYLVYCAMCKDRFSWRSKETFHILDLIYGGIFGEDYGRLNTKKNIGFSQKRENRAKLKQKMLKELWGEHMPDQGPLYPYELEIDAKAQVKDVYKRQE